MAIKPEILALIERAGAKNICSSGDEKVCLTVPQLEMFLENIITFAHREIQTRISNLRADDVPNVPADPAINAQVFIIVDSIRAAIFS